MNQYNENDGFKYTYSAKEREEIQKIRGKYESREESPLETVRKIDKAVTDKAIIFSLVFGIVGALILGFGMSLIMTELKDFFALSGTVSTVLGIILGIIGGAIAALAYPIYCIVLKKGREKVAPEIIRLTDSIVEK